ncbi:MAG: PEGA domain-containing protein [Deltaproteobacteria bacterium]|nr:PEGA domain-containing protein [Deltaproteobacteria bacterium]
MPLLKEGEELYEAHLILAKAYLAKEMTGKAEEQMRSAARLFPGHKLSLNRHAPDFSAHFKKVVEEIQKLSRYRIELSSNPSQAIVYINGFYRGTTPLTVEELTEGKHTVRIEKEGYDPMVEELLVGGKESKKSYQWTLHLDLAPHFARLASIPASAYSSGAGEKSALLSGELKFFSQALNAERVICLLEGGDRITAAIGTQNSLRTIEISPGKKSPNSSPASLLEEALMNDQSTSDQGGDSSENFNPQQTLFPLRDTVSGHPSDGDKGGISTAVPWWVWTVAAGLLIGSATFYSWNRGETTETPSGETNGQQKPSPGSAEIANHPAVTLSFP